MGVSIYANGVSRSFDCGYIGFQRLRTVVATAYDYNLGRVYGNATLAIMHPKEYDAEINLILKNEKFKDEDNDILDFLFMSDCEGKISHKTCKKIYDLIKDFEHGGKIFTYAARSDGKDYEHLKEFLKECYSKRAKMRWR